MIDRILLILYISLVVTATFIHDPLILALMLAAVYITAYGSIIAIAKRAALSIFAFNSIITLSYIAVTLLQGRFSAQYILLINLRVFLITSLTFLCCERINFFKALAFSRSLTFVMTLSYSQIMIFRRLLGDFRAALQSRSLRTPSLRDLYRHSAMLGSYFLQKALAQAYEVSDAMKSRGFFND
jgi:cobalt/nickel transport system permease protein